MGTGLMMSGFFIIRILILNIQSKFDIGKKIMYVYFIGLIGVLLYQDNILDYISLVVRVLVWYIKGVQFNFG